MVYVVGYYYGSLVFGNWTKREGLKVTYGKTFIQIRGKRFCEETSWILETVKDLERKEHPA